MFFKTPIKIDCTKSLFASMCITSITQMILELTIACPVISIKPVSNLTSTVKASMSVVTDTIGLITVVSISSTLIMIRATMKILIKEMPNITGTDIRSISIGTYLFTSSIVSQTLIDIYK